MWTHMELDLASLAWSVHVHRDVYVDRGESRQLGVVHVGPNV